MVKLVIKALLYKVVGKLTSIGTVYTGSWIASSSSATEVHLTQTLTLPAGTYILLAHTPLMSVTKFLVSFNVISPPYKTVTGQDFFLTAVTLTRQAGVYLQSSESTSVTFSYLERGSIVAIRIA